MIGAIIQVVESAQGTASHPSTPVKRGREWEEGTASSKRAA